MPAKIYYDKDANLEVLKAKRITIIGYGIQGSAQAQNLRDSGLDVTVSELPNSPGWQKAEADGFKPTTTPEAVKAADIIQILTEDHVQAKVYKEQIQPYLRAGNALGFSHGFSIHFHQIIPPENIDVFMVAPKGPGSLLRSLYQQGKSMPGLLAVYQNYTGKAKDLGLAYAKGIGCTGAGVIETTFKEETETDLFGEQTVLCGGLSELIKAGFDTLIEAGYQPEIAYFEVCHEVQLIMKMIYQYGITGMRKRVSDTAEYGDMTRGKRIITPETRAEMRRILKEIQTGQFAKEWILENQANRPVFKALEKAEAQHLIEQIGPKLRQMMPWLLEE